MPDQNQTDELAYEGNDGDDDVLVLLEQIEELVREGRKVPFSSMVMVEEEEVLALLHQVRSAVPREIREAQRVVDDRAEIIDAAQQEAAKILDHARRQAEYIVSEQGVLAEARQRGEELLRQVEQEKRRTMGQIDEYALKQLTEVEAAVQDSLTVVLEALRTSSASLDQAKRHVGA
jgi:vacuolar-type H+-ATPase subunit H